MSVPRVSARGVSVQGGLCQRGSLSRGVSVQEGLCPRGLCLGVSVSTTLSGEGGTLSRGSLSGGSMSRGGSLSRGDLCPRGLCPVMCGQYTSYWNAFLFNNNLIC